MEVLTVSSKGQVAIPAKIREQLSIAAGDKFTIYATKDAVIMKKITLPTKDEFEAELKNAQGWVDSVGYRQEDVEKIIDVARKEKS